MPYKLFILIFLFHHAVFAEVKIFRDSWGVPHIYAQTPEAAMYGFGFSQAEDGLESLLTNYRLATGTMAEIHGSKYLDHDLQQRIWGHRARASEKYPEIAPDVRICIEYFVLGIREFMRQHPERIPKRAREPEAQDVVALARYVAYQTLLRQADSEYTGKPLVYETGNQWAVSAKRSVENGVLLCADPFGSFHGTLRPYEAHLHSRTLNAFGFAVLGLPVFSTGHNQTLGWSALSGGPDAADVYEIALDSPIANRYRYDQEWAPFTRIARPLLCARGIERNAERACTNARISVRLFIATVTGPMRTG